MDYKKLIPARRQPHQYILTFSHMKLPTILSDLINSWDFNSPFASFLLPFTSVDNERRILLEKYKDYENMIVIGIGGSNLGTIAVYEALAKSTNGKKLYFLDTPDTEATENILLKISHKLTLNERVVITVISKSGSTTETIALADRAYTLKNEFDSQVAIVTISDPDSALDRLAKDQWWWRLTLPKMVGGRYSIFSNVGLFPLEFVWIDIGELIHGAKYSMSEFIQQPGDHSSTAIAEWLIQGYTQGRNIYEHWFFSKKLESLWKWYRQLLAESVGKVCRDGTTVGITPSTALGTIDLHSIAQLDLAHTRDRMIHLVSLSAVDSPLVQDSPFTQILPDIVGKSHSTITEAARIGFRHALENKGVPVYETLLRDTNEYDIGYWLMSKMLEVVLVGELLNINPFDQPNVEDYKKEMKKALI